MKYPEDAKLHLGEAYAVAGKKQQAISTLKSVGGKEGTADLARYFIMIRRIRACAPAAPATCSAAARSAVSRNP